MSAGGTQGDYQMVPLLGTVVNDAAEGITFGASHEVFTLRWGFFAKVADFALVLGYVLEILNPLFCDILAYDRSCRFEQLLGDITRSARFCWSSIRFGCSVLILWSVKCSI